LKVEFNLSNFKDEKVNIQKVYSNENCVVVLFYLKKNQKVPMHSSPSSVITTVLKGRGKFFIDTEDRFEELREGQSYIYKPKQPHGFEALDDMVVQAVIAPNPSVFNKMSIG